MYKPYLSLHSLSRDTERCDEENNNRSRMASVSKNAASKVLDGGRFDFVDVAETPAAKKVA